MLEREGQFKLEDLDSEYPISSVYENLEMEHPELYINIPIERDFDKKPVIVLTGLSGSGKDSVLSPLLSSNEVYHVVTATSRARRVANCEPENAYIWMRQKLENETREGYFDSLIKEYDLIENDFHYDYLYGLPKSSLLREGNGVPVARVDINGAITLTDLLPKYGFQPISVGVLPDSWEQVYASILKRGGENEEQIQNRMLEDFKNMGLYVYSMNYFLHNSRFTGENGNSGLDNAISSLRYLVKKFA